MKEGDFPVALFRLLFTKRRHFDDNLKRRVAQILIRSWQRQKLQPPANPGSQTSSLPSPGGHGEKLALVPQGVRAPFYVRAILRRLPVLA